MKTKLGLITLGGLVGAVGFGTKVRPWYRRWGATDTELTRAMPLDERFPKPSLGFTMATTIDASPDQVWPWLAQLGDPPRAGYYSYTWIERLVGMRIKNAGRILPEYQHLEVGQALDKTGTMLVQHVEPGKTLVLGPPESVEQVGCTWAFGLYPDDKGRTRLVSRLRARFGWLNMLRTTNPLLWPMWILMEPGAFIMQRKMLLEIRRLAEANRQQSGVRPPETLPEPVPEPGVSDAQAAG